MNIFKKALQFCSIPIILVSASVLAETETEFRGQYFTQSFLGSELRSSGVGNGVLLDEDLIRGNNDDEAVIAVSTNPINTNPFQFFNANTTERLLTVFFDDGTSLDNVQGLFDPVLLNFSINVRYYLLNQAQLTAAGKTMAQVVDVSAGAVIDHDLDWSDFGFAEFELPPPDPAPTEDDIIMGTEGSDRLLGTDSVDVFISRGGARDRMTGGDGGDFFVVGENVGDGVRNRDIIFDFEPGRDVLVITNGARTFSARSRNGNFVIQFQGGDRDRVIFRNSNVTRATQYRTIRIAEDFDINDIQPAPPFTPTTPAEDIPDPVVTDSGIVSILGTEGNDVISNIQVTGGSDAIDGLGGSDFIWSNLGNDYLLFGSSASNGVAERDTIVDFNITLDTIVLEQGVTVESVDVRSTGIAITISGGDNDVIFVQGSGVSSSGFDSLNILSVNGTFLESR